MFSKLFYAFSRLLCCSRGQVKSNLKIASNRNSTSPLLQPSQIKIIQGKQYRRLIFVGDIHGCISEFQELLQKVDYNEKLDGLILLGDLIGKGPCSSQVFIDWAFERRDIIHVVKGNHEIYLESGKQNPEVLHDDYCVLAKQFQEKHWEWLANWPLVLDFPDYHIYAIHAGANPYKTLLEHRDEELTNIRDIQDKNWSSERDSGEPWAKVWSDYQQANVPPEERYTIIFGHDAVRGLQLYEYTIGIDTGAVYGRSLTAYVYPSKSIVQVSSKEVYSQPKIND